MTDKTERAERLTRLVQLLDAYGGRRERMPIAQHAELQRLVGVVPEATSLLEEAAALDRALDLAAEPVVAPSGALIDRITQRALAIAPVADSSTAAKSQLAGQRASARIIALPKRRLEGRAANDDEPIGWRRAAAGLVAACLLGGILLGGSLRVEHVLQNVADAFGLPAEFEATTTALSDEAAAEEDAL